MRTTRSKKSLSAETIARRADAGGDVSRFFTNKGRMMPPIHRVDVEFSAPMLDELDSAARELNVTRQAAIKILIREALDQHHLAVARRRTAKRA